MMTASQQDRQNTPETVMGQSFAVVHSSVDQRVSTHSAPFGGLMTMFERMFHELD